jgi:hypothetical protein
MAGPAIHQRLCAEYRAGRRYVLTAPFEYESAIPEVGRFVIAAGFLFNGHSTPRILWPIFPPEDWLESAAAHDFAYRHAGVVDYQTGRLRSLTRDLCDQLHREILIHVSDGKATRRAAVMYVGLQVGGWKPWNDYRDRTVVA